MIAVIFVTVDVEEQRGLMPTNCPYDGPALARQTSIGPRAGAASIVAGDDLSAASATGARKRLPQLGTPRAGRAAAALLTVSQA